MHNPAAQGTTAFFVCDFCRAPWSEDRPMVEGHKGSLICDRCLTRACTDTLLNKVGAMGVRGPVHPAEAPGPWCCLCLERRAELYWTSPAHPEARACARCLRQSAATLEKDPDHTWRRPRGPGAGESNEAGPESDDPGPEDD